MPTLPFDGAAWVMYTPELGAVPATALRQKVGDLHEQGDAIRGAPDFLFSAVFDCMNLIA